MGRNVRDSIDLLRSLGQREWPQIVDVRRREAYERAGGVVPTAVWRDHRLATDWGAEFRGVDVVVYCAHGEQVSQSAATLLRSIGVDAAYLDGGFAAWIAAAGPTIASAALAHLADAGPSRWVTRERPKIDRIACPWLIRRFVDRHARFHFVSTAWVAPIAEEIGGRAFDIPDCAFSHQGELCSFDAFIRHFSIADPVLDRLAVIVRGADTGRLDLAPQCAGLLAISLGLSATCDDDDAMLERGMTIYDALYGWLRFAAGETHSWSHPA